MAFIDRMKELLEQGVTASKEFAVKAGAKAQDMGERGVMLVEIRKLEGQAQKLIGRLGAEAYQCFAEKGDKTISAEKNATIKALLADIATARESIEKKEAELESRKGK